MQCHVTLCQNLAQPTILHILIQKEKPIKYERIKNSNDENTVIPLSGKFSEFDSVVQISYAIGSRGRERFSISCVHQFNIGLSLKVESQKFKFKILDRAMTRTTQIITCSSPLRIRTMLADPSQRRNELS